MSDAARGRGTSLFGLVIVLLFLVIVAGPWVLTKWVESRFTQTLGQTVQLERVSFNPFTATAAFSGLRLGEKEMPMITVAAGDVVFDVATLWQSGVHISKVRLDSPSLHLISPPSGPLNLATLGDGASSNDAASKPRTPLTIERIDVSDGQIDWQDRRTSGKASLDATDVNATLKGYRRSSDSPMQGRISGRVGSGHVDIEGQFGVMPLSGDLAVTARQVAVAVIDPWLTTAMPVRIDDGRLGLDGRLRFGAAANATVAYAGKVSVAGLAVVDRQDQPLMSLQNGVFEGVDFAMGDHLKIDSSTLAAPALTALIEDDGRFNLATAMGGSSSHQSGHARQQDTDHDRGMSIALNRLEVAQGRFDFEDRRMSPTVALDVGQLQGRMTGLDTRSADPIDYRLKGMESDGTPVMIEGDLSFGESMAGRLHLTTEQLALSEFAPYIRRFAGYRIEDGAADLDLNYRLRDGTLTASNHIILKQLNLGEEVDQDETSLPLKNLIGLLQAETGVIDLDIPIRTTVEGNTRVDMSQVIWQAITESLGNLVTSPIDSLQALIGSDG